MTKHLDWIRGDPTPEQKADHQAVLTWLLNSGRGADAARLEIVRTLGIRTIWEYHWIEQLYADWKAEGASPDSGKPGGP